MAAVQVALLFDSTPLCQTFDFAASGAEGTAAFAEFFQSGLPEIETAAKLTQNVSVSHD